MSAVAGGGVPDIHDLIERLGAGLEGVTPGEWAVTGISMDTGNISVGQRDLRIVLAEVTNAASFAEMLTGAMRRGGGGFSQSDCKSQHANARHIALCSPDNIRALLSHIAALSADLASAKEALERLVPASKLLAANAEGCAINHYGEDYAIHGLPGWLADCLADIDAARTTLRSLNKEDGA